MEENSDNLWHPHFIKHTTGTKPSGFSFSGMCEAEVERKAEL